MALVNRRMIVKALKIQRAVSTGAVNRSNPNTKVLILNTLVRKYDYINILLSDVFYCQTYTRVNENCLKIWTKLALHYTSIPANKKKKHVRITIAFCTSVRRYFVLLKRHRVCKTLK